MWIFLLPLVDAFADILVESRSGSLKILGAALRHEVELRIIGGGGESNVRGSRNFVRRQD